jgi:hypothetical protein
LNSISVGFILSLVFKAEHAGIESRECIKVDMKVFGILTTFMRGILPPSEHFYLLIGGHKCDHLYSGCSLCST